MIIRVRLFAVLRDAAGVGELSLELPTGVTVAYALGELVHRLPSLHGRLDRVATAVNHAYMPRELTLHHGDELALIPPVSGG